MDSSQFTFRVDLSPRFNIARPRIRDNVLCQYCDKMAQESVIIHQKPKIDWLDRGNDNLDDSQDSQADIPKVEVFDHYPTLGVLKRSAQTCHLCALLSAFDHEYPELGQDSSHDKTYVMKVISADLHSDGPGLLKVQIRGAKRSGATYLMDGQPNPRLHGTLGCARTDHHEVLDLAKQWLDGCLTTHVACHSRSHPTGSSDLPTRLIQVTGFGTSVFSTKLCLGKDLPPGTLYLTLSHCWGGADIVKLTEDSLQSFLSDIPLQRLPQNFKDAAAIVLLLGYQYIWIDSLCIIQDSAADWKREAAVMGSVYRSSLCTIAALGAKDPHGGCFMERNGLSLTPCQLFPDSATRTGVYAENWRNRGPNSIQRANKEALLTRGWVVQESALSPRTLYFGSGMVYWNCTSASASEADQILSPLTLNTNINGRFYDLLDKTKNGDYDSWALDWWKIITDYTACNLSFSSDRWPAISGLATIVESETSSRLVHGLWEINLPAELLWNVINPRRDKHLVGEAPSWSWLRVDEPVYKMGYNMKGHFQMDACISLQTHPRDDSKLFVRGRMTRLKTNIRYRGDGTREYGFRLLDATGSQSGCQTDPIHGHWNPDTLPDMGWEMWSVRFVIDDRVMEAAGLVLRRVEGPDGDVWTRVGAYGVRMGHIPDGRSVWNLGKVQTITLT